LSPVKGIEEWLMASEFQKATIDAAIYRQLYLSLSGSESTACRESGDVNVGDPRSPQRDRVLTDKYKSKGVEMANGKSDQAYYSEFGKAKYMGKACG
jgi:hypothetical protein